jgi:hypothetical protein
MQKGRTGAEGRRGRAHGIMSSGIKGKNLVNLQKQNVILLFNSIFLD